MNLFTIAASNGSNLEDQIESVRARLPDGERALLEAFLSRVAEDGRVAINMRQSALLEFLRSGSYQNAYDWARERARRSPTSEDEILRERFGDLYDQKISLDRSFEGGDRFRYGALTIGGVGATPYGSFCAVIGEHAPADLFDVAYVSRGGLESYLRIAEDTPARAFVDEDAVRADAAPHASRHHLAALKLERQILERPVSTWPSLLCSATDSIQAIFVGDLRPRDLLCVRMARSDHDAFFHYVFEGFRARLSEPERALVESFACILEELEARRIALEVIDD
jgi:hypothetical protein